MIPFANKGKQLILLPEDYVKTHYIGKLYGKHFEQSNVFNIFSADMLDAYKTVDCIGEIVSCKPETEEDHLIGYWDQDVLKFSYKGENYSIECYNLVQNIFSRNTGILESTIMNNKCAFLFGCGSVGSLVALDWREPEWVNLSLSTTTYSNTIIFVDTSVPLWMLVSIKFSLWNEGSRRLILQHKFSVSRRLLSRLDVKYLMSIANLGKQSWWDVLTIEPQMSILIPLQFLIKSHLLALASGRERLQERFFTGFQTPTCRATNVHWAMVGTCLSAPLQTEGFIRLKRIWLKLILNPAYLLTLTLLPQ